MNNYYKLKFTYPGRLYRVYGMVFEADVPEWESEKYITDFLSANGFTKDSDNEWTNKNDGVIVTIIKEAAYEPR